MIKIPASRAPFKKMPAYWNVRRRLGLTCLYRRFEICSAVTSPTPTAKKGIDQAMPRVKATYPPMRTRSRPTATAAITARDRARRVLRLRPAAAAWPNGTPRSSL